jgi:hypothetical protein
MIQVESVPYTVVVDAVARHTVFHVAVVTRGSADTGPVHLPLPGPAGWTA